MNELIITDLKFWPVTFLASFLVWIMILALLIYILLTKKGKSISLKILSISALIFIVCTIIKRIIPGFRPFEVSGASPLTVTIPSDSTFPSFHAAMAFGIFTSSLKVSKKMSILLLFAALGVALGRILANVHYFTDVLAGALIGFIVAFLVIKVSAKRIK